jgi:hypothetical protein
MLGIDGAPYDAVKAQASGIKESLRAEVLAAVLDMRAVTVGRRSAVIQRRRPHLSGLIARPL